MSAREIPRGGTTAGGDPVNLLTIEVETANPLGVGSSLLPGYSRSPLMPEDGHLYEIYGRRSPRELPRVIDRRYRFEDRIARAVAIYLGDRFNIGITESIWPFPFREYVGHEFECYCLVFRLSGETLETIAGRDHRLGAGCAYLVRYAEGLRHVMRSASDDPMAEICIMIRTADLAERVGLSREELIRRLHPDGDTWYSEVRTTSAMNAAIRRLRAHSPADPAYRLYAEGATMELLAMYMTELDRQNRPGRGPYSADAARMHRVKRHLEQVYDRPLALDELASLAGIGRKKLTRDFRTEFGRSIGEYHQKIRVDVARALLRVGDVSVTEVAHRVGYAHSSNFAKVFARYAGVSPQRFLRESSRGGPDRTPAVPIAGAGSAGGS
jgi:AraC-like DNA-binding protein